LPKIAHKLRPQSTPPLVLEPSVYQKSPLTAGGAPSPMVHSSLVNIVTIYLRSTFIDPHIQYWIRLLKPHQYTAVPSTGAKVRPTPQTRVDAQLILPRPESAALVGVGMESLHCTRSSTAHRPVVAEHARLCILLLSCSWL